MILKFIKIFQVLCEHMRCVMRIWFSALHAEVIRHCSHNQQQDRIGHGSRATQLFCPVVSYSGPCQLAYQPECVSYKVTYCTRWHCSHSEYGMECYRAPTAKNYASSYMLHILTTKKHKILNTFSYSFYFNLHQISC